LGAVLYAAAAVRTGAKVTVEAARLTVKVAPRALLVSLSLWERVGVREAIMVPTTYIVRGGAGAVIVRRSFSMRISNTFT